MSIQLTNRVKELEKALDALMAQPLANNKRISELEDNQERLRTIVIEQAARISQLEYLTNAVEDAPAKPKGKGK